MDLLESFPRALLHTHAAEHPGERKAVRSILGRDDVDALNDWGVIGRRTVLAHGVQLTPAQRKLVASAGTSVVHCPSANLKLGSGIARVARLRRDGVVVGLGADGAPCNNNLDPFVEMRHAALLAKVRSGTTSVPAREALRIATIEGARALGLDAEVGSIEPGKRADIAVVRLDGAHCEPGGDAFGKIVYCAHSSDVRHVMIDGAVRVFERELMDVDVDAVVAVSRNEASRIARRAKI